MLAEVIDVQPLVVISDVNCCCLDMKSGTCTITIENLPRPQSELCCKTLAQEEPQFFWECPAAVSEWRWSDYKRLILWRSYTWEELVLPNTL